MFLAEADKATAGTFAFFDLFMLVFTAIIAISLFRLSKAKQKNKFALGFTSIALLVFLAVDGLMVLSWMGQLRGFQDMIFGG